MLLRVESKSLHKLKDKYAGIKETHIEADTSEQHYEPKNLGRRRRLRKLQRKQNSLYGQLKNMLGEVPLQLNSFM